MWARRQCHFFFPADVHVSLRVRAVPQEPTASAGGFGGGGARWGGGSGRTRGELTHHLLVSISHRTLVFLFCFFPPVNKYQRQTAVSGVGPARPGLAATTTRNKKGKQGTNRSVSREHFFRVVAQRQQTERAGENGRGEGGGKNPPEMLRRSWPASLLSMHI